MGHRGPTGILKVEVLMTMPVSARIERYSYLVIGSRHGIGVFYHSIRRMEHFDL